MRHYYYCSTIKIKRNIHFLKFVRGNIVELINDERTYDGCISII